jgi:hypothetical protein
MTSPITPMSPSVASQARRAAVRVALALFAALAALAALAASSPAAAQPAYDYGATAITATRYRYATLVAQDAAVATPVTPALVSVLHQFGLARFPTSQSALPIGYVSAVMTGTGFGGVGVSFISGDTPDHTAIAEWTQVITNIGTTTGGLDAHYDIPQLEASLFAGPLYGSFVPGQGPYAAAGARLTTAVLAPDGTERSRTTVFDYFLSIERRFQGDECIRINHYEISDDLAARNSAGLRTIDVRDVCGIESLPFGGTVGLGMLAPGDRLVVEYRLSAQNIASSSRTPELGYQALVGDPFGVSGAGFSVVPAAVPEPAAVALLGTGLVGAAAARGRLRERLRGRLPERSGRRR